MKLRFSRATRGLSFACALLLLSPAFLWAAKPDTDLKTPSNAEKDAQGKPTDYNNPKFDGSPNGVPHYHVTVCAGSTLGAWHPWGNKHRDSEPKQTSNKDTTPAAKSGKHHGDASSAGGTDGGVAISGRNEGTTDVKIELKEDDGTAKTIEVTIHVIDCSKHKEGQKGITALPGFPGINPNPIPTLIHNGQLKIDITGTGETIGHIADCSIQNLTDQPIYCSVPPSVLESKSGKNQNYVCPKGENVAINSHDSVSIPIDGVCVNRNKPPVGHGIGGDLVMNPGDPNLPGDLACHIPTKDAQKLLHSCAAKYDAVDELQQDGALNDMPYKDKQKQKDICLQWSTWTDPEVCQLTGAPPATKDDLKKVVYKQMEPHGPMTPETKKKVDQGIDTIFSKIELTSAKTKDLEKAGGENVAPGGAINVSNETPTPPAATQEKAKTEALPPTDKTEEKPKTEAPPTDKTEEKPKTGAQPPAPWPQTQEKVKKGEKKGKKKQEREEKRTEADHARDRYNKAESAYNAARRKYRDASPRYRELLDKWTEADQKAKPTGASQQDKDNADKARRESEKQESELSKDFDKTPEGQKLAQDMAEARVASEAADKAYENSLKPQPQGVKP